MTPRIRTATYLTAALVALSTTVGCGLISSAKKLADHAVELGDLSEKITNAEKLTYVAKYKATDGSNNTVAQDPPKVAYLSSDSDFIYTGDAYYNCDTSNGDLTCAKTATTGSADPDAAALAEGGGTYFTGALGITLLAAALLVPSSDVADSNEKIAGLESTCVKVTDLEDSKNDADDYTGFSMCVADNGVVTKFLGTMKDGKQQGVTLQSFSTSVDGSLFAPPANAKITDTGSLGLPSAMPSDSTAASGEPSDSPSPAPSAS